MFKKLIFATVLVTLYLLVLSLFPEAASAQFTQASTDTSLGKINARPGCNGAFLENNGLVIMEVESADLTGSWSLRTDITESTGNGYYEWKYGDTANTIDSPGQGILTYVVQINMTGTYRFLFRTAAPHPTEHNDSWLRFRDNEVEARTEGGDVIDLGQDTWFKVYQGKGDDSWNFAAHTDEGPHQVYALINTPGEYRLEVSGRSTQFKMDRLVLYHENVSYGTATNVNTSESQCLLPVELTSFEGLVDDDEVVLSWRTASEQNNAGFDVEFSDKANGVFSKIGFVAGRGISNEVIDYQYKIGFSGFEGQTVYYRLKQFDFDGTFEYSEVVAVNLPAATTAMLHPAYPNPFNPSTNISFTLPVEEKIKLTVYDAMGRQVQDLIDAVLPAGHHTRLFEATGVANGTYIYKLETSSQTLTGTVLLLK